MGRAKTKTEKIVQKLLLEKDYWKWEKSLQDSFIPIKSKIKTVHELYNLISLDNIKKRKFSEDEIHFIDELQLFSFFCKKKFGIDSSFLLRGLMQQILFGKIEKKFEPRFIKDYFSDSGDPFIRIEFRSGVTLEQLRKHISTHWKKDYKMHFLKFKENTVSVYQKRQKMLERFDRDKLILEIAGKSREQLGINKGYKDTGISKYLREKYDIDASSDTVKKVRYTRYKNMQPNISQKRDTKPDRN